MINMIKCYDSLQNLLFNDQYSVPSYEFIPKSAPKESSLEVKSTNYFKKSNPSNPNPNPKSQSNLNEMMLCNVYRNHFIDAEDENSLERALQSAIEIIKDIPCLTFQNENEVWTYTFCNDEILQSVSENMVLIHHMTLEELNHIKYVTGRRRSRKYDLKLTMRSEDGSHFLHESFPNGDTKLCAKNRETLVIYSCDEENESILSFEEFSVCLYHMKIGTPRLCSHPYFKSQSGGKMTTTHKLECQMPNNIFFNYESPCKASDCYIEI